MQIHHTYHAQAGIIPLRLLFRIPQFYPVIVLLDRFFFFFPFLHNQETLCHNLFPFVTDADKIQISNQPRVETNDDRA